MPASSTAEDDDFAIVLASAQAGEEAGVAQLWRRYNHLLVRYLEGMAPSHGDDLASDTWISAARNLRSFAGDEAGFRRWLFTIGQRRLMDLRRRQGRRPESVTDPVLMPEGRADRTRRSTDDPMELAASKAGAGAAVATITAALSPAQAEIVLLRVVAGLDTEAVADLLGKKPGAVRVALHRALKQLAVELGPTHPAPAEGVDPPRSVLSPGVDRPPV